jgi:exo-beta-1,3-glucanase (GH17 family)
LQAAFAGDPSICWIAYSPTHYDPESGENADIKSIMEDLNLLMLAGVNGIITYSADNRAGLSTMDIAYDRMDKIIVGVWDPTSEEEMQNAIAVGGKDKVVGFVVGNEGLNNRYTLTVLQRAMDRLRQETGKPVTTTEELGDYNDPTLMALGDWVFPNVHPYFAEKTDPAEAAQWTEAVYDDFVHRAGDKPVLFKEVGLPSAGDESSSPEKQRDYYKLLNESRVQFAYFEAFDQTWKTDPPVEPHWGMFDAERRIKPVVDVLCGNTRPAAVESSAAAPFVVYSEAGAEQNHYVPSGFMGDTGDIRFDPKWNENVHAGSSAIQVKYMRSGAGPSHCDYTPPCLWAGVYWQEPADNWGEVPGAGFDLSAYTRLTFWARAEDYLVVEFGAGGLSGDTSAENHPQTYLLLTPTWKKYSLDLSTDLAHPWFSTDLSLIAGGFYWSASINQPYSKNIGMGNPAVFYLDDIQYE